MKINDKPEWFSIDTLYGAIASSLSSARDQWESAATDPTFMIADCRVEVPVLMQMSGGKLALRTPTDAESSARPERNEGGAAQAVSLGRISLTLRPRLRG